MKKVLVTGASGFIGYHTVKRLSEDGLEVICVDNKKEPHSRLKELRDCSLFKEYGYNFLFFETDICEREELQRIFETHNFDYVCHLAGQGSVQASVDDPFLCQRSNLEAFLNVLEMSKKYEVDRFIYASSSSVYGESFQAASHESDTALSRPLSLYAATKRSNELMAYAYFNTFGLKSLGLRFFTVYGPWGRPDMAVWKFTEAILKGETIQLHGGCDMWRDFTYIDDIASGISAAVLDESLVGSQVLNLGSGNSVSLLDLVGAIEKATGKKAKIEYIPRSKSDPLSTSSDITKAQSILGYEPKTQIGEGIQKFVDWYREFMHFCRCIVCKDETQNRDLKGWEHSDVNGSVCPDCAKQLREIHKNKE